MKKIMFFVVLTIFLGCSLSYASATADVYSYIDWTSLSIVNGDSAGITWGGRYEASYTNASNNIVTNSQLEQVLWNSPGGVSSANSVLNATGYGYTTAGMVVADVHSFADGIATTNANASASIHRRDWFMITANSELTFSLNYSFLHSILAGNPDEGGSAYSVASLVLLGPANDFDNPIDYIMFDIAQNTAGNYPVNGTLSVSGLFQADTWYSIEAHLYGANSAYSPRQNAVPEPATILLLGFGLIALTGTRIMKKSKS